MPLPPRVNETVVNAELERVLYQLNVIQQEFEGLLYGLAERQLSWSPSPRVWSIGQNIDHMNLTNHQFLRQFENSVSEGHAAGIHGDGPYTYGWLARTFFRLVEPPAKRKFRAPKNVHPSPQQSLAALKEGWNATHARLEEVVRRANGLDLERVRIPSPVTKLVKFNLGMGFWIQTAHDRRHLAQARAVRNHRGFPA